jgi:hypothetical protein
MRSTDLEKDAARRVIRTDDRGTLVLDTAGQVVAEHGTDRHALLLEEHRAEGWQVLRDGHVAPEIARAEPPDTTPARGSGPTATVRDGEAG